MCGLRFAGEEETPRRETYICRADELGLDPLEWLRCLHRWPRAAIAGTQQMSAMTCPCCCAVPLFRSLWWDPTSLRVLARAWLRARPAAERIMGARCCPRACLSPPFCADPAPARAPVTWVWAGDSEPHQNTELNDNKSQP